MNRGVNITLADRNMKVIGGHLNKVIISGAYEIFLTKLDYRL